ncbi:MAG TPA: LemA family protein [Actinocrinis sp.]|nr:LemA family protein [Actinocrinis sp.]
MTVLVVVVVILLVVAAGAGFAFNGLVRRRNRTGEAWSQIDVELKRRHDLIPNLVQAVQGYAVHESATFQAVTASRASAISAGASGDPGAVASAENTLNTSLRSLFAVAENYPALRAEEGFVALQGQLTSSEDKVEYARHYYNTSVRDYNTATGTFPRTLIAGPFGFRPAVFFQSDDADRAVPLVDFTFPAVPSAG